ncbi:MAG: sugar phosphate isomerase/epimerase [Tepidisphaeraceae bacterium]
MNAPLRLSVQLYTLRQQTEIDFARTLRDVAKIGFAGVELAGFGNLRTACDVRKALDDAGLVASGAHVPIETMESNLSRVMDDFDEIGTKLLIVPWLDVARRGSADAWKKLANTLTSFAMMARQRGFTIAYHNHDFEFERVNGQHALDLLWQHTDPSLVKCELDLHWVARAGLDPIRYLRQIGPTRLAAVHLKDQDKTDPTRFAPVGSGTIDFPNVLAALHEFGTPWGVVEQDDCYGEPPLECIRRSYAYLASQLQR